MLHSNYDRRRDAWGKVGHYGTLQCFRSNSAKRRWNLVLSWKDDGHRRRRDMKTLHFYRKTWKGEAAFQKLIVNNVKVKWSSYRPGVAQRVGRGIALLFLDHGTRRGWVVSSTPRLHFTAGKDPVPILQEAGWAPQGRSGQVRKISSPPGFDPGTSSPVAQSLYRLSYRAYTQNVSLEMNYCGFQLQNGHSLERSPLFSQLCYGHKRK